MDGGGGRGNSGGIGWGIGIEGSYSGGVSGGNVVEEGGVVVVMVVEVRLG